MNRSVISRSYKAQSTQLVSDDENDIEVIYSPSTPQENIIFFGTPPAKPQNIIHRMRTGLWFLPDYVGKLMHSFRPLSYLALFFLLYLGSVQTYHYAQYNPSSAFSKEPEQHLIEGAVGSVSTLNPLYVTHNQIERDIQALVFDRLVTIGSDGNPKPELATTWAISEDGMEYTFFLRSDVTWHDGEEFNAEDVIFTFQTVQALEGEDSFSREFNDLTFQKIDDFTVVVNLPETNPTLMDTLAFQIVPEHILGEIRPANIKFSSFNKHPIGTGPFMIQSLGSETLVLLRHEDYYAGTPTLEKITYRFYSDEVEAADALRTFEIHTLVNPTGNTLKKINSYQSYTQYSFTSQLRQKLIYFNLRNTGPLSYPTVRQALSAATDRQLLVKTLVEGGTPSIGPIPQNSWAFDSTIDRFTFDIERANQLLDQTSWIYPEGDTAAEYRSNAEGELIIPVTYLETETNNNILSLLQEQWKKAGIRLELNPQSYERISSETVPRRNFDALLFEIECTPDPDKYNFWHSSNIEYPGLNLSGYNFERVDILLERARTETEKDSRAEDYGLFQMFIMTDMPALYLYHPNYTFIAHTSVKGILLSDAVLPHQRYDQVELWKIVR